MAKEYKIEIDPHILDLLGPSLYTNIYYVLAELIANSYDGFAHNVYVIEDDNSIIVEDDGIGMSYENGDIKRYLDVAHPTLIDEVEEQFQARRKRMGRKGIGKLAALAVSDEVLVKTISKSGEKSGFVLSKYVESDKKLKAIDENDISFVCSHSSGTSIKMQNPKYKLGKSFDSVKRNIIHFFPAIGDDFVIHIIREGKEKTISRVDTSIVNELATLITIGDEYKTLANDFEKGNTSEFCQKEKTIIIPVEMANIEGNREDLLVEIEGWIGTYKSAKGRKKEINDFPDNFISLYANKKMGEFNILPLVGQNKMTEVYVVGQLHIDAFENKTFPDMALSNRQGYKSDDIRYIKVTEYVKEKLLPQVLKMRDNYTSIKHAEDQRRRVDSFKAQEEKLKEQVKNFATNTSHNAAQRLFGIIDSKNISINQEKIQDVIDEEINKNSGLIGLKAKVDSNKKKILISHTKEDKDLADVIFKMLIFNNVKPEDIIYTNGDNEKTWIPEGHNIYDYLRTFFVDSISTQKIYVIFVTSTSMSNSWGAITEVGATWITKKEHKIFNIKGYTPQAPLDVGCEWHETERDSQTGQLQMSCNSAKKFVSKIRAVCDDLGYSLRDSGENLKYLTNLIVVEN